MDLKTDGWEFGLMPRKPTNQLMFKAVTLGFLGAVALGTSPSFGAGLEGTTRDSFIMSSHRACTKTASVNPGFTGVSELNISAYCLCFSLYIADRVSVNDLFEVGSVTSKIRLLAANEAPKYCVAHIPEYVEMLGGK